MLLALPGGGGEWLTSWTSDMKVGGWRSGPCHRLVSLDKKLYSRLSLSTQVYKWVPGGGILGPEGNLRWTNIIQVRGRQTLPEGTLICLTLQKPVLSSGRVSFLCLLCDFTFPGLGAGFLIFQAMFCYILEPYIFACRGDRK